VEKDPARAATLHIPTTMSCFDDVRVCPLLLFTLVVDDVKSSLERASQQLVDVVEQLQVLLRNRSIAVLQKMNWN